MNHIFYQTKTNYNNTGDALINYALINILRKYGKLHANYSPSIPSFFLDSLGIKNEERVLARNEFEFIKNVINCAIASKKSGDKVFVFSGLGDMHGSGAKLVLRNLASGLVFPIFRILGIRIVRIGRSVGPISKTLAFTEFLRGLFLSHYYVRDTMSLKRCHSIGIKKTEFCPDMSWLYDLNHETKINSTNSVMVNLRNSIFDNVEEPFIEATLQRCEELLKEIEKNVGEKVKVFVAYQIYEDAQFGKTVYEYLREKYDVEFIDHQMALQELEYYYSQVDYHISNRMHSLLSGYKYGSLPIALIDEEKHVKISATFYDCDLDYLVVDINKPVEKQQISNLVEKRGVWMNKLFSIEKENSMQIENILNYIVNEAR